MKIAFTQRSLNYMAQAKTLADSFREYNPDGNFVIGLVDELIDALLSSHVENERLEALSVRKVQILRFNDMAEVYSIEKLNT